MNRDSARAELRGAAEEAAAPPRLLREWLAVVGAGSFLVLLGTVGAHVRDLDHGSQPWGDSLARQATNWLLWVAAYPLFFRLAQRFPLDRPQRRRSLLVYGLLAPVVLLLHGVGYVLVVDAVLTDAFGHPARESLAAFVGTLRRLDLPVRMAGYAMFVAASQAFAYHARYRDTALKSARLEAQLAVAQLDALKMQLHPHFLFNTLNSISALLGRDPQLAESMIARLGDFLRLTLESRGAQEIPLHQELEFLRCYLAIEELRFQDRLTTSFDVDPEAASGLVPNLVLQPLVENAVRHGISRRLGPGSISVSGRRRGDRLLLEVRDDGAGAEGAREGRQGGGVGLANTEARLRQLYGDAHRFGFEHGRGQGCVVTIEIPYRRAAPAAPAGGREDERCAS